MLRDGKIADGAPMVRNAINRFVRAMIGRDAGGAAPPAGADAAGPMREEPRGDRRPAKNALTVDAGSYEDKDGVKRLSGITIGVGPGESVGVAGVEGNGQSELGAILAGMQTPSPRRVFVDDVEITQASPSAITAAGVGVVPEDRHAVGCILGMSVADNLFLGRLNRFSRLGLLRRPAMARAANALMRRYDVRASGVGAPMSTLSGGNQQKAVLARELSLDPLVFLLAAQPARGLDIGAVAAIYQRIREARDRGVGVLLISSELDELISVADRIIVIFRGRIVGERPASAARRPTSLTPSAEAAIGEITKDLGAIDVLVNNAGIMSYSLLEDMPVEMWDEMMAVNLRSVFLCSRLVIPGMKRKGWGRIINLGSQLAQKGAPNLVRYGASKAAVIGFTRSLARELIGHGVTVNAICPGPIDTELSRTNPPEWKNELIRQIPPGRYGEVEEMAPTAVLLASEGGSFYVGAALHPNGGDLMA